ncbi:MAG TPA: MmpS family transport accessory protein [Actinoplanes sp.]|nr:MmpS family transport accessory protein [Actinoplanes sp.]
MSYPPPPAEPPQPYDGDQPPQQLPPTAPFTPGAAPAPGGAEPPGQRPTPTYRPGKAQPVYAQPDEPAPAAPSYPATTPFPSYDPTGPYSPSAAPQQPCQAAPQPSAPQPPAPQPPGQYQPAPQPPGQYQPGQPYAAAQAYPPGPPSMPPYHPGSPGKAPAPRRSNGPLIAVVVAVSLLLCGGTAVAGVLITRNVAARAKAAVDQLPTELPALPTELPVLPTELPTTPENEPGSGLDDIAPGKTKTVVYEVTGNGRADITYTAKLGESPQQVTGARLPWRKTVTIEGSTYVSVIALRSGVTSGKIACRTTVDGEEAVSRSAEGRFAVVNCGKLVMDWP